MNTEELLKRIEEFKQENPDRTIAEVKPMQQSAKTLDCVICLCKAIERIAHIPGMDKAIKNLVRAVHFLTEPAVVIESKTEED